MKAVNGKTARSAFARLGSSFLFAAAALLTFAGGASAATIDSRAGLQRSGSSESTPPRRFSGNLPSKNTAIEVDENLSRQLESDRPQDFAIEFSARPDLRAAYDMQWNERGRFVHEQLKATAERSQAEAIARLRSRGEDFNSYWINNVILVRGGTKATLESLMTLQGIKSIRIPPEVHLILPDPSAKSSSTQTKIAGTNIARVGADQVWAQGITGTGVTVGVIDSGVRYTHEALVTQYRGNLGGGNFDHNFNWLDPELDTPFPAPASTALGDQHGTHVTGTIVGDDFDAVPADRNQIGMAPGAEWIACLGFPASGSVDNALLACGQFMLAPTDLAGNNANPDLRPEAVNNSWGDCGTTTDTFYSTMVESWNAAGVIPVFAAGNASNCGYPAPPGPNTAGNPGRYTDVFTVGSTGNNNGQYASHSNWGPTDDIPRTLPNFPDNFGFPNIKPDIVAPGVNVRSSIGSTDTSYDASVWTGTSMSTPHVVGLMALMIQAGECLRGDFATIGTIIKNTAFRIPFASNNPGGGEGPGNIPNFATGWGEIDAPEAVAIAGEACGPQGIISGTVTNAIGGLPVPNVDVELFTDENVRIYTATTDLNGNYSRQVPVNISPATYTARVSAYGFQLETVTGINVTDGNTTDVDIVLDPAQFFTVSGNVGDSLTGWGLHSRINITGFPGSPVWTDPVTGNYSVSLAEGFAYNFSVTSQIAGYAPEARVVGPLTGASVQDFDLVALPTCAAPGYSAAGGLSEDFEGAVFPPAGWTVLNNGGDCVWNRNDRQGPGGTNFRTNHAGGQGFAADADADWCGADDFTAQMNTEIRTPPLNLAALGVPVLELVYAYRHLTGDSFNIAVSTDGGTNFTTLFNRTTSDSPTGPGTPLSLSLAPFAASTNAIVRFRYIAPDWDWYALIDQVRVRSTTCSTPTGGLVVGNVRDGNTLAGLNGAAVSVDSGGAPTSSAASADPAVGNGFYYVYANAGGRTITAAPGTLPAGYVAGSANATVTGGQTVRADVSLGAGRLTFAPPTGPSASVPLGGSQGTTFTATNTGTQPVTYAFQDVAVSQDFENAFPPTGWTVTNNGGDCVWLTNVGYSRPNWAGGQGISATADSDRCGSGTTMDTSLTSPALNLSTTNTATLSFVQSFRVLGASRLHVETSTDNGGTWATIFTQSADTSPAGPGTPVNLSLASLIGYTQAKVRFHYVAPGWHWHSQVDQIRLFTDAGTASWFALNPQAGALAPAASTPHNAVFDSGPLEQPGTYVSGINVIENTPYAYSGIAATFNVTAPATWGTISGTVSGTGQCDAGPATPVPGATVLIQGGTFAKTLTADANGNFTYQMSAANAPFSVTASASGYVTNATTGVPLAAGGTSTANVTLRLDQPCFDVVQSSISAMLQSGDSTTRPLQLVNTGAGDDTFLVSAGGDASVATPQVLSQSLSQDVLDLNGVACTNQATGFHTENSFIRVYDLAQEGFSGNVSLTGATFKVETAVAGAGGSQPAEVAVYSLEGPLSFANMTLLALKAITIPDGNGGTIDVSFDAPVVVAADTQVVLEVFIPDGVDAGDTYFPGTNSAGETAPSYIASASCGLADPVTYESIGFPEVQLVQDLKVSAAAPCSPTATPVPWLSFAPTTGPLGADSNTTVTSTINAAGQAIGSYGGAACVESTDPFNGNVVVPVTMDVAAAIPDVDLSVDLTSTPASVTAGDAFAYGIAVSNAGPEAATGVNATLTLPLGVDYVGFAGAQWTCTNVASAVSCDLTGSLAVGPAPSLSVQVTATQPGTPTGSVAVSSPDEDTNPANNVDTVDTTVAPAPVADLTVAINMAGTVLNAGATFSAPIVVANVGGAAATGVQVALDMPAGFTYNSATGTGWTCSVVGQTVTCALAGSLSPGLAPALSISMTISASTVGEMPMDATVQGTLGDPNMSNNDSSVTLTVRAGGENILVSGFEDGE